MIDPSWKWFTIATVNPEPWAIGDLSVGRKAGRMFPIVGRNNTVWLYQQAIKEALGAPLDPLITGRIELMFFFWRNMAEYKTPQARTARNHEADLTNMVKSTEDALQGVLFKNDKDTRVTYARIMEQGPHVEGGVVFAIRSFDHADEQAIHAAGLMGDARSEIDSDNENEMDDL